MNRDELNQRLSKISTVWSVLRQAHAGSADAVVAAQQLLIEHYSGAIYRYLLKALGDPSAADDLTQEFALSLVRGEFRRADPQLGRFRDYVKTVLFHLVSRYRKRQRASPPALSEGLEVSVASPAEDADLQFQEDWRDELLARTWQALAQAQPTFFTVLHFRAAHPDMPSTEMAAQLSPQLGKPVTPDAARQTLHRAREMFADLLLDEVAHSLEPPTLEGVEEELHDLNLLDYCRPALERRLRDAGGG